MTKIVGVRFHQAGKIYYFDPLDFELETGMHVIVETARGVEMGTVLIPPKDVEDSAVVSPLKPVIRIATDEDEKVVERNRTRAKEAFTICKEKIIKHELDMKLVGAEYTFDNNKLLFYFTADGRIDFRELVKDLASVFRTRIELRQIGVRDETKMMGGVGICGRPLCCSTYLSDFVPVSIKMAKEQNLSLNPTKISGVCGRLMCCLKNEQDTYEYLNSRMPSVGDTVTAADGTRGEVSGINVLRQLVKVIVDIGDEKELREYPVDELRFQSRRRRDVKLTAEELKELEGLEDNESEEEKAEQKDNRDRREKSNRGNRRNNREDGGEQGSRRNNREDGGEQGNRRNNRRNRSNRNQRYDNNRGNQSNSQPEGGADE
jgi:cell fate regulator YaaT (PSP1 superfamily)